MTVNEMKTLCDRLDRALQQRQVVRAAGIRGEVDAIYGPYHGKIMVGSRGSSRTVAPEAITVDGQPVEVHNG